MIALALSLALAHAQSAIEAVETIDRAQRSVRSLGEVKNEACWDCPLREPEICSTRDVCRAFDARGSRDQLLEGLPNYQRQACATGYDEAYLRAHAEFMALVKARKIRAPFEAISRAVLATGDLGAAEKTAGRLPEDLRAAWLDLVARTPGALNAAVGDEARLKKIFTEVKAKTARVLARRDAALGASVREVKLAEAPPSACESGNAYLDEGTLFVCAQLRSLPEATLTTILARELARAVGPCPRALATVTECLRGGAPGCPEDAQAAWIAGEVLAEDVDDAPLDARRRVLESAGFFAAHACKLETGLACTSEPSARATFDQVGGAIFAQPAIREKLGCPKTAVKRCD